MAITVRDIRSKQFTSQRNGYNKDEVDDFLDELADQLEEIIKENLSLAKQLKERPVVESEPVVIEKPVEVVRREEPKLRLFAVCQRIGEGKLRDQVDIIFRSADNRNLPDDRIRGHELPLGKLREAIIEEGGVVGPVVGISDRDGDEPPSVALCRADQNPARSLGIAGLYADRAGILP